MDNPCALYAEARSLSTGGDPVPCCDLRDTDEAAVRAAQARLFDSMVTDLPARIVEAAKAGRRDLELLVFDGSATYDGEYFFLYLLLGPRGPDRHASPRVVPLLDTLRTSLAPFEVTHIWRPGTVQNQVLVSWGR